MTLDKEKDPSTPHDSAGSPSDAQDTNDNESGQTKDDASSEDPQTEKADANDESDDETKQKADDAESSDDENNDEDLSAKATDDSVNADESDSSAKDENDSSAKDENDDENDDKDSANAEAAEEEREVAEPAKAEATAGRAEELHAPRLWLWVLIGVGLYALFYFSVNSHTPAKREGWRRPKYKTFKTFAQAINAAKALQQPIFLDLYADWCYPCKKLERLTFSHPSIAKLLDHYLVVKFNIDKPSGKRLVRRFRVRRFPTTLMLNADGKELERVVGYYAPRFFRPAVKAALKNKERYVHLVKAFRKRPKDWKLRLKLADRALLRRYIYLSRKHYNATLRYDSKDTRGLGSAALFGLARSWTRIGKYRVALPFLHRFHRRFPNSRIRIDAYRLELYCLDRLRHKHKYQLLLAKFRKLYPGQTTRFE